MASGRTSIGISFTIRFDKGDFVVYLLNYKDLDSEFDVKFIPRRLNEGRTVPERRTITRTAGRRGGRHYLKKAC